MNRAAMNRDQAHELFAKFVGEVNCVIELPDGRFAGIGKPKVIGACWTCTCYVDGPVRLDGTSARSALAAALRTAAHLIEMA